MEIKNFTTKAETPRQMPNNEASQSYDEKTESMSFWMVFTTIYTLIISYFLSNAIKKLLVTFLSLQIVINMFLLANPFPGNIVNVIKKLKPIISFNVMKSVSVYVEKGFTFDTLGQISKKEEIMPKAKSMGI